MVRLKVALPLIATQLLPEFQSQYGSIKSIDDDKTAIGGTSFNPNMVRLKGENGRYTAKNMKFQSQYGSIKRWCAMLPFSSLISFNPNMVRLKGCI